MYAHPLGTTECQGKIGENAIRMRSPGALEIRPSALTLMRRIAGEFGDRYVGEILLPSIARAARAESASVRDVREALSDPYRCLECIYAHYAFSRRGKDRAELASIAVEALHLTSRKEAFQQFLSLPNAGLLWETFVTACKRYGRKPMEQLNLGVIAGLAELAQEVYRQDGVGSIAGWILKGVLQTDRLEPQFLRIVDIRGVGPKLGSVFVRDTAFLFSIEDQIDPVDRLYLQPIDKWIRMIAPLLGEDVEDSADWILAGKLAKYTRKSGISGVRFNMGASFFGTRIAKDPQNFNSAVDELLQDVSS